MELEFLEKLFQNLDKENSDLQLLAFKNHEIARLFATFQSIKFEKNIILLSESFFSQNLKFSEFHNNSNFKYDEFIKLLIEYGFEEVDQIYTRKQFSRKGDVITIFSQINEEVYRIEFFGDKIEKINLIDNISFRVKYSIKNFILINLDPNPDENSPEIFGQFDEYSPKVVINSSKNIYQNKFFDEFKLEELPLFHKNEKVFNLFTKDYKDYKFYYFGKNFDLIPESFKLINGNNFIELNLPIVLDKGFILKNQKIILLTDREILSTLNLSKSKSKISSKFKKFFDNEVNIGDFLVHEAHGVGVYRGIETKVVLGEVRDYVVIEYLEKDKLLIPLDHLNRLTKYVSSDGTNPRLTRLGIAEWEHIKKRLKKSVEDIAGELLEIYAKKNMQKGIDFEPDTIDQIKFENDFKYQLTEDQFRSLNEVKDDMESEKPMDRLIIGDVGFGKTEIALRAAFKAIQSGKQVMVLAPTTILVTQLYEVFSKRLIKYNIKIARISRFDGTEKNKQNIQKANSGKLDVIIGTHRLLSKDVEIPNLGLLVIDEEQRFGVKQKEKIRKLRTNIDVLSMSATPIPRTLQMALTGIKDISIIATPPKGRLPVHNEVIFSEQIAEKIREEVRRKGQVFLVHNKIEDLPSFIENLKKELGKEIKITFGHGQMRSDTLEKVMREFGEGVYDVLVATTIIENGLDIPTVNTIIIDDAHTFGLSQLYQLRGRVGRSDTQGFCYLVVPKTKEFIDLHKNPNIDLRNLQELLEENNIKDYWVNPDAISRIEAILDNQDLGAGFKIASRDLEIRGSGNILGSEQSGHINAVGYEMFIRLLEQEIDRIRKIKI